MTTPDRDHGGTPGWRERLEKALARYDQRVASGHQVTTDSSHIDVHPADLRAALAASSPPEDCPYDTNGDGNCGRRYCPYCGEPRPRPAGVQVDREALLRAAVERGFSTANDAWAEARRVESEDSPVRSFREYVVREVAAALAPLLGTPEEPK